MSKRTARTVSITTWIGARPAPTATALQPRNDLRTGAGCGVALSPADDRLRAGFARTSTPPPGAPKTLGNATPQGTAMNEIRLSARNAQRDFHWAWYLAPCGTAAVVCAITLLSGILLMTPGKGPALALAANAMPIATEPTDVGPALPTKPVPDRPAPAPAVGTEIEEQPPTF